MLTFSKLFLLSLFVIPLGHAGERDWKPFLSFDLPMAEGVSEVVLEGDLFCGHLVAKPNYASAHKPDEFEVTLTIDSSLVGKTPKYFRVLVDGLSPGGLSLRNHGEAKWSGYRHEVSFGKTYRVSQDSTAITLGKSVDVYFYYERTPGSSKKSRTVNVEIEYEE